LLLIPFIENAFKYGVSTREAATILIHIVSNKKELKMTIENQKFQSSNEHKDKSGIGLENTKQRLELIYNNRYALKINDLEEKYSVDLKIELC
jgi:two-component system, LytTR family, sensor kinase